MARLLWMAVAVTWALQTGIATAAPASSDVDASVKKLYDEEWEWRAKELGQADDDLTAKADYLPHVDAQTQQRRLAYWSDKLAALNALPQGEIQAEKVNAAVFRTVLEAFIAQERYRDYEATFTSGGSFWASLAPRSGFANAGE